MPALSETKQGMKKIMQMTRENFKEMWMPLMEAIIRKTLHMFQVCESQERRVVLIDELATCADSARARALMTELNELAGKDRMVAFRSHTEEDQNRFQLAATYSDEWVKGETPNGPFWVRMVWICQKGTHPSKWEGDKPGRCMSMTISKAWHRNVADDPLAEGQSWTCKCQRQNGHSVGKFRAAHGVLCEMKLPGFTELCYVRAEAPNDHINDMRAIHYKRHLNPEAPEHFTKWCRSPSPARLRW